MVWYYIIWSLSKAWIWFIIFFNNNLYQAYFVRYQKALLRALLATQEWLSELIASISGKDNSEQVAETACAQWVQLAPETSL